MGGAGWFAVPLVLSNQGASAKFASHCFRVPLPNALNIVFSTPFISLSLSRGLCVIGGCDIFTQCHFFVQKGFLEIFWRGKYRKIETDFQRKLKIKVVLNNIVVVAFQYEVPKMALECKNKLKNVRSN